MELVYGKGLVGLFNDSGRFDHKRLGWDRHTLGQDNEWKQVGGIQFDALAFQSGFLGFAYGLQYNQLSAIDSVSESNCFYATYGLLQSVDQLQYDWDNLMTLSGTFNWFNLAVYDPVHITSNFSVVYE